MPQFSGTGNRRIARRAYVNRSETFVTLPLETRKFMKCDFTLRTIVAVQKHRPRPAGKLIADVNVI
jgi:hypothetical protein